MFELEEEEAGGAADAVRLVDILDDILYVCVCVCFFFWKNSLKISGSQFLSNICVMAKISIQFITV